MKFPQRIETHVTESKSFKIFSNVIPDNWIIREATGGDYGIDCYIEICSGDNVTGQMFSVQLKGKESIEKREDGRFATYYGVNPATFNYWYNLPITTIFIFIDTSTQEVYFMDIKKYVRENYTDFVNEKLVNVKIPVANILEKKNEGKKLENIYQVEIERSQFEFVLSNFVTYIQENIQFMKEHSCRDCFMPLEGEEEIRAVNLYKESKYLAVRCGIEWKVKSLSDMSKEGKALFGPQYLLYEKQVAEFVTNLVPIIKGALLQILEIVTVKELDFWLQQNPLLYRHLKSREFKEQILKLDECL